METTTSIVVASPIPTLLNQTTHIPVNTTIETTTSILGATGQAFTFILFILVHAAFLCLTAFITFTTTTQVEKIFGVPPEKRLDTDTATGIGFFGFLVYFGLVAFYGHTISVSWGEGGNFFEAFILAGVLALCFWAGLAGLVFGVVGSFVKLRDMWRSNDVEELLDLETLEKESEGV